MNLGEAYDQLIIDLGTAVGTKIVTDGVWDPPCVVLGAGGWVNHGVTLYPEFIADVVLDAEVVENYALSMIKQQKSVLEAMAGRSYLTHIRPDPPELRTFRGREWLVGRITFGLRYDE